MARPRRRNRPATGRGSLAIGIALIVFVVLCAVGLAYAYFAIPRAPRIDEATLCPTDADGGPRSTTVVLVDATDDLSQTTRDEVTKRLTDLAEQLPPYALLDMRVLDPSTMSSRSIFARCNPGDGTGISELTGNPALARRRWLDSFQAPLKAAVDSSLASNEAGSSPIMAAIQGIAIETFTGATAAKKPHSLIIVSDMLEKTSSYDQYRGDLSFKGYQSSPAYQKFRTDLEGADVTIWYVQRATKTAIDTVAHAKFWADWIADNMGHLDEIIRLQGMN